MSPPPTPTNTVKSTLLPSQSEETPGSSPVGGTMPGTSNQNPVSHILYRSKDNEFYKIGFTVDGQELMVPQSALEAYAKGLDDMGDVLTINCKLDLTIITRDDGQSYLHDVTTNREKPVSNEFVIAYDAVVTSGSLYTRQTPNSPPQTPPPNNTSNSNVSHTGTLSSSPSAGGSGTPVAKIPSELDDDDGYDLASFYPSSPKQKKRKHVTPPKATPSSAAGSTQPPSTATPLPSFDS